VTPQEIWNQAMEVAATTAESVLTGIEAAHAIRSLIVPAVRESGGSVSDADPAEVAKLAGSEVRRVPDPPVLNKSGGSDVPMLACTYVVGAIDGNPIYCGLPLGHPGDEHRAKVKP